jgi:hypothetical protein
MNFNIIFFNIGIPKNPLNFHAILKWFGHPLFINTPLNTHDTSTSTPT